MNFSQYQQLTLKQRQEYEFIQNKKIEMADLEFRLKAQKEEMPPEMCNSQGMITYCAYYGAKKCLMTCHYAVEAMKIKDFPKHKDD